MSLKVYKKLAIARKEMGKMERSKKNPRFNSSYTTLEDLYNVAIEPLLNNGLLAVHEKVYKDNKMYLVTKVIDIDSSEYIFSESLINIDLDPQAVGSQLTYFKKYDLSGLLTLRSDFDDDDGERAVENIKRKEVEPISMRQIEWLKDLLDKLPEDEENKVLEWCKVKGLEEITASKFQAVLNYLNKKIKEQNNGNG